MFQIVIYFNHLSVVTIFDMTANLMFKLVSLRPVNFLLKSPIFAHVLKLSNKFKEILHC